LELSKTDRKDLALGIYANKDNKYSKRSIATTLKISESGLYYKGIKDSKDLEVKKLIEQQYETDDTLGCKKLAVLLKAGKGRISRIMLKYGIIPRKRSPKYKYAGRSDNIVANKLLSLKDIENYEVLFSDIFEFRLSNGRKIYGCFLIRKKTRQVLSFSYSFNMEAKIVSGSIRHIYLGKDLQEAAVIFHSDQGKQFGAEVTLEQLLEYGFERSMSRAGTPTDNGIAERFVGIFKHAVVERFVFESHEEFAEFSNKWLNFYNNQRPHESLGQKSPNQFARDNKLSVVRIISPNLL
jgi:putative transposase